MKKWFLLFLIFIILVFIIPTIFTRSFLSTTTKEKDNIISVATVPQQEEKIETYNYKEHGVIKLLHKGDNSVEEIRIRRLFTWSCFK